MNKKIAKYLIVTMMAASYAVLPQISSADVMAATTSERVNYAPVDNILQAGTVIPATLLTSVTSDNLEADVIAQVRQDVYDSITGTNILVPAGTRLIGKPTGYSGNRINIAYYRMILPNGESIKMPDFSAVSGTGYAGMKDKHSNHSWKRFQNSILSATLGVGMIAATSKHTNNAGDRSFGEEAKTAAASELIQSLQNNLKEKDNGSNIKSTTTIRIGYQFNVLLNADLKIRPYESL